MINNIKLPPAPWSITGVCECDRNTGPKGHGKSPHQISEPNKINTPPPAYRSITGGQQAFKTEVNNPDT